jgi:hypothetical protein
MKLKYILVLLSSGLISTATAAFVDTSSIEEEPFAKYEDRDSQKSDRADVLAEDFERSYDAAQARKDRNVLKKLCVRKKNVEHMKMQ